MERFLKKVAAFLGWVYGVYLLLVALFVLIFSFGPMGFHPDHGTFAKAYEGAFQKRDADMLLVGSSRMAASLDADVIAKELGLKCYNLAFNQANLSYVHDVLRAYLSQSARTPTYVVLDVSWFSFDDRRLSYKEYAANFVFQHPEVFYDVLLLNKNNPLGHAALTLARSLERRGDVYVDFDTRRNRWTDQDSTSVNYEFDPNDAGFRRTFPEGRAKMVPEEVQVLSDIMELLQRHKVTLVLYTSPEDRLFSESQQNREVVYAAIAEVAKGKVWMDYTLGGELYQEHYEKWLNDSHHIYFKRQFTQRFLRHFQERFP
jgi:hypothetical protein